MFKKPKIIKYALIFLVTVLFVSACAYIQLGPKIEPFKEAVLEGEGSEKILMINLQGLINNQKDHAFTGATTALGMVEEVREIISKAEKDQNIKALDRKSVV